LAKAILYLVCSSRRQGLHAVDPILKDKYLPISLQRSHESLSRDNKLIRNNNYAAKIGVLGPAAPIFAEVT
jgi:hypothetical protein